MHTISRKTLAVIATLLAVFVVSYASIFLTLQLTDRYTTVIPAGNYNGSVSQRYEKLNRILNIVESEYYTEVDENTLLEGAINGMLGTLNDPYTFYYTPEMMQTSKTESQGNYCGIGVLLGADANGRIKVLRVFRESPALESGICVGDYLVKADGVSINAATQDDFNAAIGLIKGEENSFVLLTVQRGEEYLELKTQRRAVVNNRVEYQMLDNNVGYMVIYEFQGDAVQGVDEALSFFTKNNAEGLILDVRSNPGGQVDLCVQICDRFLPEGIIVYTLDKNGRREDYTSDASCVTLSMVVLVNESSASASEIFTAALKDYGVAKIVGTKTYGKGIVQTQYMFSDDGSGVQLTTSHYYTPSGICIHGQGIQPDLQVQMQESYDPTIYTPDFENDNQLKAAYDLLLSEMQ